MPETPPSDQPQDGGAAAPRVDLRGQDLRGRDLRGMNLRGALLGDADLRGQDLRSLDLSGADLSDCDLEGARLQGALLVKARLLRARGNRLSFEGADLSGADLTGATLPQVDLRRASLRDAVASEALLQNLDARGADLSGLKAPRAALDLGKLDGAQMPGVDLTGATLEGASLEGVSLVGAQLRKARLDGCALRGANLEGADLRKARLSRADLHEARLEGAQARGLALRGTALDAEQLAALERGGLQVGPGLLRRGASALWGWTRGGGPVRVLMSGFLALGWPLRALAGLAGSARERLAARRPSTPELPSDTPGAGQRVGRLLQRASQGARQQLRSLVQSTVRLSGLSRGAAPSELGPGVSLVGRDLRGMKLSGLDLRGADLRGAFLDEADLRGVVLAEARLDGARLRRARLEGADLQGASAVDLGLEEARLDGADLRGLNAPGARLPGASLSGAKLAGAVLRGADFSGARLADLDLEDADLSFALFEQADLAGASLDRAQVWGAELAGALGIPRESLNALRARGADVGGLALGRAGLERALAAARAWGAALLRAARAAPDLARRGALSSWGSLQVLGGWSWRALSRAPGLVLGAIQAALGALWRGISELGALSAGAARGLRELLGVARDSARGALTRVKDLDEVVEQGAAAPVAPPFWSDALLRRAQALFDLADAAVRGFGEGLGQGWAAIWARARAALSARLSSLWESGSRGAGQGLSALPAWGAALLAQAPGLITLGAAVALTGYLASRFLAVENLEERVVEQQAVQKVELGATEEALQRYEALLARSDSPADRSVWRAEMAAALLADGRRAEAADMLRLGVEEAGDEPELRAEALMRLAEGLRAMGDFEAEAQAWSDALAQTPVSAALRARAIGGAMDAAVRLGDPDQAQVLLQAQLDALAGPVSRSLDLRVALAEVLVSRGDYDRALAVLDAVWEMSPTQAQQARLLAALASTHEARGALAESLSTWQRLINDYPSLLGADGQVLLSAASVALRRGETAQAARWLDQIFAEGASPRVEAQATLLKARLEREEGRPNTAALLYRQVLTRFSQDRDAVAAAQLGLAETLWAVDDEVGAEELTARLLASGDAELVAQVLVGRARILHRKGDGDGARALYKQVLEEHAGSDASAAARAGLAELELEEGRFAEAIRALRALQAEGEGSPSVEAAIAEALLRGGNLDDAELAFRTLAETYEPGTEGALLGALGLARVAEARGDLGQARAGYERVLAATTDPGLTSQALESLAALWMQAGREDEAMAAYRRTLQALPEGDGAVFDIRLSMAGILQRRGEWAQAEEQLLSLQSEFTTPARQAAVALAMAELLEAQGRPAEARERYQVLMDDPRLPLPQRDDVIVGLVRSTLAAGDAAQALVLCERWTPRLVEESTVAVLRDLHVQTLRALGRNKEADALAGEAPEGDTDPLTQGMNEAAELANNGDFDGAIARYEALIAEAQDPDVRGSLSLSVAQTLGQAGQIAEARQRYRQVLAEQPEAPDLVFSAEMGLAWLDRVEGQPQRAAQRYATLQGPDSGSEVWRLEQLAQALSEAGEDAQAEAAWKRMITTFGDDPVALATGRSGLAALLRSRGELRSARALYEQVARTAPEATQRHQAALSAAMILVDEGGADEARARLEALLQEAEDPEVLLQARIGLSAVLLEQGSPSRALRALEGIDPIPLGPAFSVAWTQQKAACLLADGEVDKARAAWQDLVEAWPEDAETAAQSRLALGDIALGQGEAQVAATLYRGALEQSPDRYLQARSMLGLAQALRADGRGGEAQDLLDQLIREYPEQGELVSIAAAARGGG